MERRTPKKVHRTLYAGLAAVLVLGFTVPTAAAAEGLPWMDKALSAEQRSDLLVGAMSLDQKIQQIAMKPVANTGIPNCDFSAQGRHVEGIPALAIPTLRMTNGPFGNGDCLVAPTSTGLTSALTVASSFDPDVSTAWGDSSVRKPAPAPITCCSPRASTLGALPTPAATSSTSGKTPTSPGSWPSPR
ncbi:hypothetical protein [Arthrobacter sp. UYEF20]|uniref:hypothetical protein n=1 Tax=Arthrobacter sp. UYEF20 TaxID=1756363 RepID=UPI00339A839E